MLAPFEGTEPILGVENITIGDFWRWAYSDILSNTNRSVFVEYIVGVALGVTETPRSEWGPFDLRYGKFKIEVKASADVQSWFQRRPSKNVFSIRRALEWDSATGTYSKIPTRCADIYVFCHYPQQDKLKVNLLDLGGWDFYIIPVESLNAKCEEMKSISLSTVKTLAVACKFDSLQATVDSLLADGRQ